VVLKQLTQKYAITQNDINDLYIVSVKKYLTPQPALITTSGQEPEEKDFLHFWVTLQSVLMTCQMKKSLNSKSVCCILPAGKSPGPDRPFVL